MSHTFFLSQPSAFICHPASRRSTGARRVFRSDAEAAGGQLSHFQVIRHKTRYFIDGAAIGGGGFVEKVFAVNRGLFGSARETGARKPKGAAWGSLRVLRDLRTRPVGEAGGVGG
jgi:hypothetical protein